jgi:predicted O-linked N-acetylglucosamine transferase (SPINDLY family)
MFPLLCIRGGGSLTVSTHLSLQNRLLAINYINDGGDDELYIAHRLWGKRFNCLFPKFMSWENSKKMDRPLVIGYISPDFFTHSVSYFIEAPLVHHDYTNYQIVVYSAVVKVCYILHVGPFVPCTYELQGECYHG